MTTVEMGGGIPGQLKEGLINTFLNGATAPGVGVFTRSCSVTNRKRMS